MDRIHLDETGPYAAALAAVATFLDELAGERADGGPQASRWREAGRLEACGLPARSRLAGGGWRVQH